MVKWPICPVLNSLESPYYKIVCKVTEWFSKVDEFKINSSELISDKRNSIVLEEDEAIFNVDVVSLYANVPVNEAIDFCIEYMFSGKYKLPLLKKKRSKHCFNFQHATF